MKKKKDEQRIKLQTLRRLWRDFPELLEICGNWSITPDACVPIVCTLDADILNQLLIHDEWWAVVSEGTGEFQRRWVYAFTRQNRTLRTALREDILLSQRSVEYIICRPHDAQQKQQLKIYKPAKGQTIKDLCFNLTTLV